MDSWSEILFVFGALFVELVALFLIVGFLATLINRRVGNERLQRWLGGGRFAAPVKGILLGSITPFCSCSTIPVLVGLVRAGTPFAATTGFLIASPLLNPIILGIVALLFGWQVMLGYAAVTFVFTIIIALAWSRLGLERYVKKVRVQGGWNADQPWAGLRAEARPAWQQTVSAFRPMVLPMLIGISVGAVIYGAIPQSFLTSVAGPGVLLAVPIAAIIGIPLYIRMESALPVGLALSSAGMGVGPIFALLIGGAGASIPEVSMLTGIFKPQLVAAFVGSILAVAMTGGLVIPLIV
ncbi:permease [Saccharomonospora saliphila]|uniref:permease n=1 Tax=Saccharomonospora saliphila TaxID=369829 RepID=UPI0003759E83|nr:permease [Saccharomonospora saliphila]